jgi:hypothetical protein
MNSSCVSPNHYPGTKYGFSLLAREFAGSKIQKKDHKLFVGSDEPGLVYLNKDSSHGSSNALVPVKKCMGLS